MGFGRIDTVCRNGCSILRLLVGVKQMESFLMSGSLIRTRFAVVPILDCQTQML
jgi:hypothetical protein